MKTKSKSFIDEFIAQGRQEGRQEESLRSRYEFARKLLLRKMPIDEVCELTDLTVEEVKKLAADLWIGT